MPGFTTVDGIIFASENRKIGTWDQVPGTRYTVIWYTVIWLHGYSIKTQLCACEKLHSIYLREFACELTSSWPPARVEVGSGAHLLTSLCLDSLDRLDSVESSLTSFFAGRAGVFDQFTRKAPARFWQIWHFPHFIFVWRFLGDKKPPEGT